MENVFKITDVNSNPVSYLNIGELGYVHYGVPVLGIIHKNDNTINTNKIIKDFEKHIYEIEKQLKLIKQEFHSYKSGQQQKGLF